jgi:putative DNA primase/helicase
VETIDLAARVSTGTPFPGERGGRREPGAVILANAEDDLADTVKPRLVRAGADCDRIHHLDGVRIVTPDGTAVTRTFTLHHLPTLEKALKQTPGVRLVVVDPISAFLGDTDSHCNAEVRGLLAPLAKLAADYRVAVVVVTHLNKSAGTSALYRATGSLGLIAAARTGYVVVADPANDRRRLFLPAKNNLAEDSLGFAYSIIDAAVAWEHGRISQRADEALAAAQAASGDEGGERKEAADFLRMVLREAPVEVTEVMSQAKGAGFSTATLRRAKADLGIRSRKKDQFGGGWVWVLPPPKTATAEGAQDYADPFPAPNTVSTFGNDEHLRVFDSENAVSGGGADGAFPKGAQATGGEHLWTPEDDAADEYAALERAAIVSEGEEA